MVLLRQADLGQNATSRLQLPLLDQRVDRRDHASVSTVDEIMPPTIGAAMRLITSEPVPVPHMIGSRPAMMATTVIIFGRTRSTAPSITAP